MELQATEALIVRLAEECHSWGYKRISGELKKLGHQACPSYVRDVSKRNGLPPVPSRKGLSWKQFLQAHLEATWATDFYAAKENESSLLSGERNLTNRPMPGSSVLSLTTNQLLGWGKDMHSDKANVCFGDGSARQVQNGFVNKGTNRLAVP